VDPGSCCPEGTSMTLALFFFCLSSEVT
jgi:hypothetical protein